jgi:hypothetical protein
MTNTTPAKQTPANTARKPANSGQTHAEFLQSLRDAHAGGRPISYFRQWPVEYLVEAGLPDEWLRKCGLIQADGAAAKLPNQCSQRQFAEIVSKLYGKPVNQATISRAIKDGLNVAVTPSNGRLKTDAALRWWEQNKAGAGGSAIATEAEDKAARQRIARQREELELEEIQRQQSGKWVSLAIAKQAASGAMREYHDFLKGRLESTSPESFEAFWESIGLTQGQVAASKDYLIREHRKVIDDIETHAEQKVKEYSEQLKTEIEYAKS